MTEKTQRGYCIDWRGGSETLDHTSEYVATFTHAELGEISRAFSYDPWGSNGLSARRQAHDWARAALGLCPSHEAGPLLGCGRFLTTDNQ
jgi:hypothetical protein